MQQQRPIIFFDGLCHLCNGFVDFTLRRDLKEHFQFAPLQGETAAKFLTREERDSLESVILLDHGQKYFRSDAVLAVLKELGGIYYLSTLGYSLPKGIRDFIYNWVAKNRYGWFGKRDLCRFPTQQEKNRLLP